MLVLGSIHIVSEGVRCCPEPGLKSDISGRVSVLRHAFPDLMFDRMFVHFWAKDCRNVIIWFSTLTGQLPAITQIPFGTGQSTQTPVYPTDANAQILGSFHATD